MNDQSLRFVVGKARAVSGMSHAWLLWKSPDGWLILDATNYSAPIELSRVGPNEFIPQYSYTASGKFVHLRVTERMRGPTRNTAITPERDSKSREDGA